jgi:hypothetical protein
MASHSNFAPSSLLFDCAMAVGSKRRASGRILQSRIRSGREPSPGRSDWRRSRKTLRPWSRVLGERRIPRKCQLRPGVCRRRHCANGFDCPRSGCCLRARAESWRLRDFSRWRGTRLASRTRSGSFRSSLGNRPRNYRLTSSSRCRVWPAFRCHSFGDS